MRCLILGFGYMGQIRYQFLKDHPDIQDIRIYDPGLTSIPQNLENIFLKTDIIPWESFDVVFVCTPNNLTAQYCVKALYNGHVFCEKPAGRHWEDLQGII